MAAGSIVISLLLATGSFQTDTERARKSLEKFEKQAIQTGKVIGTALAGGAIAAAALFEALAGGAAEFKDLEETTGASAENIASFAVAAATAGVEVSNVAGSMNKLTKNLVGVDDESKAAGAALKALGLNVDAFKKLDPAAQYEAVGQALSGFADGAEKSAVAQALFGKSGAEQLKVFKALEEAGGRQTILTQRQIELADAYKDAQAKNVATLKLYAQAAATEMIPALTDLTAVAVEVAKAFLGIDQTTGHLNANNGAKAFAESAADSLAFLLDSADGVVRVFQIIGKTIGAAGAQAVAVASGEFRQAMQIGADWEQEVDGILSRATIRSKLAQQRVASAAAAAGGGSFSDARFESGRKPRLAFDGAETEASKAAKAAAAEAKKAQDEINRYIEGLGKQLQGTLDLTEAEKVLADIRSGSLRDAGVVAQQVALSTAEEIDAMKEAQRIARERADFKNRDFQAGNDAATANAIADQTRLTGLLAGTEKALFDSRQANLIVLQNAFAKGDIQADQYADAVRNLFGLAAEDAKSANRAVEELGMTFSSAFEDAIVDGKRLSDVLQALERDLIRIALRKLVIEPATNGLVGAITNRSSGSTGATADPSVGPPEFARGLDYVPYDGFIASLHKGEKVQTAADAGFERRNGSGSGGNVIVEYHGPAMQSEKRIDPDGNRRLIISVVSEDIARGGQTAQAIGGMNNRPWYQR